MAEGRVLALAAVSLPRLLIVAYLRESLLYGARRSRWKVFRCICATGDAPALAADTRESQRIIGGSRLDKAAGRRGARRSRPACALLGGGRVFLVIVSDC